MQRPGTWWRTIWILVAANVLLAVAPIAAIAQEGPDAGVIESRAVEAYEKGDLENAADLFQQQIALQPGNFVPLYNLAVVRSAQGQTEESARLLVKAVENGFDDLGQMKRDPGLAGIRETEEFKKLAENWPAVLQARRQANVERYSKLLRGTFERTSDARLRLEYLVAADPRSFTQARTEVERIAAWCDAHVIPGLLDADAAVMDPWVVVVLPRREDFMRFAIAKYGTGATSGVSSIGGSYEHDSKMLIAQDLGGTLRHEFFHVLHWRSCQRLGQQHAIWVQEGLCSLVEDYELDAAGELQPVESWRTNIVKRMERNGLLLPISKLAVMDKQRFSGSRPLATYAQARTLFLYLWREGKLKQWYETYTDQWHTEPTGVRAFEMVFEKPIALIDRDYRAFVRGLATVPEELKRGDASLGVAVEGGEGDGPVIVELTRRRGSGPALRLGDVITSIDGKPTRDMPELVRVLGGYTPGDEVEVSYRRGKLHGTVILALVAAE